MNPKNFLKEHWPHDPKHGDIEKYILWQECGQQCPYTGEKISFEALFIRNEFQVEHIYPRWRSLDDSFKNKTLCKTSENAFKSNHIPYEAYGDNAEKYDQIIRRLESMVKDHKMHKQKLKRFQAKEIPNGFVNNQLTNTSYIARQARDFMKRLWPDLGAESPVKVQFFSGRATSQLRHLWGLNSLLSKDDQKSRDDHRHHALDALVVACITPAMIDQLSRYFKNKDNPYSIKPVFSLPWERFYADMGASLNAIIVSHRVSAKISGPLHEGSYFKRTGIKDGTTPAGEDYEKFVIREPLNKPISVKNIENIVDERVREIVAAHLEKYGGNAKAAFGGDDMPHMVKKDGSQGPVIKRVRIYDKSQPRLMVEAASSWVKKGNNHHIAIYENYSDGNPKKGNIWEICSLYDAAQRLSRKQPVIEAYHQQGGKLLFSLVKGDMIAVPDDHGKIEYWVVSSLTANGQVPMVKHNDAALDKVIWKPRCYLLAKKRAYKVSIDPIGKIHKAK
ncbi:MAG: type II CRISPR RNA-guided endonuclease Cas9 [Alphaproteobacteria bacterium]